MAGLSPTSEPSASQQESSQCLPPLVNELQLHSTNDDEDTRDSPTGNEKHLPIIGTPSVASNELQLGDNYSPVSRQPTSGHNHNTCACDVRRLRNGKEVVISGSHQKQKLSGTKKQPGECNLALLPSEDTHYMHEQYQTGPMNSSQEEESDRQKQPTKKKASKHNQAAEKVAVRPPHITRSRAKLMAQNGEVPTVLPLLLSDKPPDSRDQTMGDTETHQKTRTSKAQVKYNKPLDCSVAVKDANYLTSKRLLLASNNRGKNSIPQQNSCHKGSHEEQHASSLPSEESLSQPLGDVTNSSCDDIFADITRPSFIHLSSSQNRVYQLVAGKKNKKPRKQQSRKAVKKHTIAVDAENHPSRDQDQGSTTTYQHDNCLRQCHHCKASQHTRTSGEDGVSH